MRHPPTRRIVAYYILSMKKKGRRRSVEPPILLNVSLNFFTLSKTSHELSHREIIEVVPPEYKSYIYALARGAHLLRQSV